MLEEIISRLEEQHANSNAQVSAAFLRNWIELKKICHDKEKLTQFLEERGSTGQLLKMRVERYYNRPDMVEGVAIETVGFMYPEIKQMIQEWRQEK